MRFSVSAAIAAVLIASVKASVPTIAQDWSALVLQGIQVIQGSDAQEIPNVGVLCPYKSTSGCKVQTAFEAGFQYFDYTNNRTAFKGPTGQGIVTLYNLGKEFQVDAKGNCQAYCPLPQEDSKIEPLVIDPKSDDKGTVVYNGQSVQLYENVQPLIETEDWYVTVSGNSASPVADIQYVYFLGLINTTSNMTFQNFKAGTPPASQFTVTGISSCPKGNNCPKSDDDASDDSGGIPGFDDSSSSSGQQEEEIDAADADMHWSEVPVRRALRRARHNRASSAEIHRMSTLYYDTFLAKHFDE